MTNRNFRPQSQLFGTLVLPITFGLAMYLLLDLLINRGVIADEVTLRYLTGHPISRITTFMFCIGMGGLLIIANNVFDQFCNCGQISLDQPEKEAPEHASNDELSSRAASLIDKLHEYRRSIRGQYLWRRLREALAFIERTDSTTGVEDELKYLADLDRERQQRRYSLVRIVIWATPMLGFLGTVLGISQALGGIQVGADNDFQQMLGSLRSSLFVAFDTTALALTLSIVLMFFQFFIDRFEIQLLESVDRRVHDELLPLVQGRSSADPQIRAVEQMGRSVIDSSRELVRQQSEMMDRLLKKIEAPNPLRQDRDFEPSPSQPMESTESIADVKANLQRLSDSIEDLKRRAGVNSQKTHDAPTPAADELAPAARIIQFREALAQRNQAARNQAATRLGTETRAKRDAA